MKINEILSKDDHVVKIEKIGNNNELINQSITIVAESIRGVENVEQYVLSNSSLNHSYCLIKNNIVIGTYFMYPENPPIQEMKSSCEEFKVRKDIIKKIKNENGIEGVALAVHPKYRNKGYGKLLIEYPKTMGYDYIWGMAMPELNNIDHWLKRRKLIAICNGIYITIEFFNQ